MRRTRSRHVGRSVLSGATTPNRNGLVIAWNPRTTAMSDLSHATRGPRPVASTFRLRCYLELIDDPVASRGEPDRDCPLPADWRGGRDRGSGGVRPRAGGLR